MNHKERDERDTPCPHCGGDARWSFLNQEASRIEIMCPECGRFEMAQTEFDQFGAEFAELNEPERAP